MLNLLSLPGEPLDITGDTDNPFPPGFVDLIEPVSVDLDSNVGFYNISGDKINQNLKQYNFGPKTILDGESTVDKTKFHDIIDSASVLPVMLFLQKCLLVVVMSWWSIILLLLQGRRRLFHQQRVQNQMLVVHPSELTGGPIRTVSSSTTS